MKTDKDLVKTTAEIKNITVVDGEVLQCKTDKLCFPEAVFEMIEKCKLCGKWI